MGNVQSKVSYLKGLVKGLHVNSQSVEGKLLLNMVEVLDSVAENLQDIQTAQKDLEDYVDSMDEDLESLEDIVYEDPDGNLLHLECPHCHAEIVCEAAELEQVNADGVACPTCGSFIYDDDRGDIDTDYFGRHNAHPGI